MQEGIINEDGIDELSDLVVGKVSRRQSDTESMVIKNNTRMGIQFAAAAPGSTRTSKEPISAQNFQTTCS